MLPYQQAINEMNNRLKGSSHILGNVAFVSIQGDKGVDIKESTACHAGIGSASPTRIGKAQYIVSRVMNDQGSVKYEEQLAYLDYLLNRSPMSRVFEQRDAEWCLEHRYIICRVDQPSNLVAAGLISSRRLSEMSRVATSFYKLTQAGCPEWLAFPLSQYFHFSDGYVSRNMSEASHYAFSFSNAVAQDLLAWMNDSPKQLNRPYSESREYTGVNRMFISGGKGSTLGDLLKGFKVVVSNTKSTNPFAKSISKPTVEKFKEDNFLAAVPRLVEEVKRFVNS